MLEHALIKLSVVASDIFGVSGRSMIDALITGERDRAVLAGMARGRTRPKQAALIEAFTGRFDDHHAELAEMLLDQIDSRSDKIDTITIRSDQLIAQIPAAAAPNSNHSSDTDPRHGAAVGLNMAQFPTAADLVSWAKLSPRTIQSGPRSRSGKTGKGNGYLKGVLGEAATGAAKTNLPR